jgi:hypothetical protein
MRSIGINTGSNALLCGLIAALAVVALLVGIAEFNLTRPADYSLSSKPHSQADRGS